MSIWWLELKIKMFKMMHLHGGRWNAFISLLKCSFFYISYTCALVTCIVHEQKICQTHPNILDTLHYRHIFLVILFYFFRIIFSRLKCYDIFCKSNNLKKNTHIYSWNSSVFIRNLIGSLRIITIFICDVMYHI